jgi:hypothetical protein
MKGVALKKSCAVGVALDVDTSSLVSGEMASHVLDPSLDWLVSSPSGEGTLGPGGEVQTAPMDLGLVAAGREGKGTIKLTPSTTTAMPPVVAASSDKEIGMLEVGMVPPVARGRPTRMIPVVAGANKEVSQTVRKSSRHKGMVANKPFMEKAKLRAAEKNLVSGNFTSLDSYSDAHLAAVASDSCVVFTPSAGTLMEAISMIRAKERVQDALEEVAFCKEQEAMPRAAREAAQPTAEDGGGQPEQVDGLGRVTRTVGEAVGCQQNVSTPHREAVDIPECTEGVPSRTMTPATSSPGPELDPVMDKRTRRPRRATLTVRKGQGKRRTSK